MSSSREERLQEFNSVWQGRISDIVEKGLPSVEVSDPEEIVNLLNRLLPSTNHMFYASGGGNDFAGASSNRDRSIDIKRGEYGGQSRLRIWPTRAYVEVFPEQLSESYVLVEHGQMPDYPDVDPRKSANTYSSHDRAEYVEVDGRFYPRSVWDEQTLGLDENGIPLPLGKSALLIAAMGEGKILLTSKGSLWNRISDYRGDHAKMSPEELRETIREAIDRPEVNSLRTESYEMAEFEEGLDLSYTERRKVDDSLLAFADRFIPPDSLPYNGREGGYQYIHGGPVTTRDGIEETGDSLTDAVFKEVENQLDILFDGNDTWSRHSAEDDFLDDRSKTKTSKSIPVQPETLSEDVKRLLEEAPQQKPGLEVGLVDGKLSLVPHSLDANGQRASMLKVLHEDLILTVASANTVCSSLGNSYPDLKDVLNAYSQLIDVNFADVDPTQIYLKGLGLDTQIKTVRQAIERDNYDEYPPLEQNQAASIDLVLQKHGLFVAMTDEGQALIQAADLYSQSSEEKTRRRNLELASSAYLITHPIVSEDLSDTLSSLSSDTPGASNERRNSGLSSLIANIVIFSGIGLCVAGPALATSAAIASGYHVGGTTALGVLSTFVIGNAAKKTKVIGELTEFLANKVDVSQDALRAQLQSLGKLAVEARDIFSPIAEFNGIEVWFNNIHGIPNKVDGLGDNQSDQTLLTSADRPIDQAIMTVLKRDDPESLGMPISVLRNGVRELLRRDPEEVLEMAYLNPDFENYIFTEKNEGNSQKFAQIGIGKYAKVYHDLSKANAIIEKAKVNVLREVRLILTKRTDGLTAKNLLNELLNRVPTAFSTATTYHSIEAILADDLEILSFERSEATEFDETTRTSFPMRYYRYIPRN